MTTLRLTNASGENGGEWFCAPDDQAKLAHARRILAECIQLEPKAGWRLETRGDLAGWHPVDT